MVLLSKQLTKDQLDEKKSNPIMWFFFAILIPVIVAIIITIVILSIAGIDVGAWAKETGSKIPGISTFVQTDEEKDMQKLEEEHSQEIQEKDKQILDLEDVVNEHVHTIEKITDDALKLEQQLQSNETGKDRNEEKASDDNKQIKEMAASYRKMSSKQAAKIIEQLERSIALDILHELSNDVRGHIIEEMSEDKAVEITEQYIKQTR